MLTDRFTGGSALPAYRLYRLDGAGKFMSADWIEADSDAKAIEEVQRRVAGARFELWDRYRLVGQSHPEGE